jgi:adenylate cyclase
VIRAFEPLQEKQFNEPATKSYLDAYALLKAEDAGAVAAFAAHVGKQPEDRLAAFHLKRLLNGAKGSRIAMD